MIREKCRKRKPGTPPWALIEKIGRELGKGSFFGCLLRSQLYQDELIEVDSECKLRT